MRDGVARHPVPGVLLAADDDPQLVGGVLDQPHHLITNIYIIFAEISVFSGFLISITKKSISEMSYLVVVGVLGSKSKR